ncbi:MAG: N-acetylmuramoyl-L-alanine amidase [Lachnospiraceae bacterium]|nr:N-acetylmuramoyl-L-alanine amidase [Lachnospiraceae bacterium]MCI9132767.1 N-acetylmuramoyl-L-alanine amidase [Lachnospiraceae bacterium]
MDDKKRERYRSKRIRQIQEERISRKERKPRANSVSNGSRMSREEKMRRRKMRKRQKMLFSALIYSLLALLIVLIVLVLFILASILKKEVTGEGFGGISLPWVDTKTVIMLDPGHGGKDQGTSYGDILEKDLTLEIVEKVKKELESAGYEVQLTRSKDEFVNIRERASLANKKKPDLYVSIHCNFLEQGEAAGIETYYAEGKGDASRELAEWIQSCTVAKTNAFDRNVRTEDFVVIKDTEMPAALIETGFLSDAEERKLLQDQDYQKKLAEGIAEGIIGYWETQKEAQEQQGQEEPEES